MSLGRLTVAPGFLMDFQVGLGGNPALAVLRVENGTGRRASQPVQANAGGARRAR
jgi:hypothetical protein